MKHILKLVSVLVLFIPHFSFAAVLYSQTITLTPGWNIVSTPKVLDSHSFSLPESSSNFDVFVLNAQSTSGWSTLADMNQTEFTPLFGYFINNKSSTTQTLAFNYKSGTTPNERLFERNFTKSGWYSIGVANPSFVKSNEANGIDTDNPSSVLNSISGQYSSVVDMTDSLYRNGLNSVAVASAWTEGIASNIDSLNDFRETKAYAIAIRNTPATYSGFQNNESVLATSPSPHVTLFTPDVTAMSVSAGSPHVSLWQANIGVSVLPVQMQMISFKMTGSISPSSLSNIGLYVDGIIVASSTGFNINNKVIFSLPQLGRVIGIGEHIL